MKRQLRSWQTRIPSAMPFKFNASNFLTSRFGLKMDRDFRALFRLGPISLAIDIGGNWGQSVHALKFCAAPQKIVTFEPNEHLASRLQRRFANDPSVQVEACGLSNIEGTFRLYVPRYDNFVFDGLASLDREEAEGWLNDRRIANFDPAKLRIEEKEVAVKKLDDYDFAPDVVKIDVQGAEHAVVRGGIETFRKYRPVSIVEAPSPALVAEFAGFGMKPYYFNGKNLLPHVGNWKNTLFLTDEQAARIRR